MKRVFYCEISKLQRTIYITILTCFVLLGRASSSNLVIVNAPPPFTGGGKYFVLDSTYTLNWNNTGQFYSNQNRSKFQYRTDGLVDIELNDDWNNAQSKWIPNGKQTHSYSSDGLLITRNTFLWNATTNVFDNEYKYDNTYNNLGQRIESVRFNWDAATSSWIKSIRYVYVYDGKGALLKRTQYVWNASQQIWINNILYAYTNNSNGVRLQLDISNWVIAQNNWSPTSQYLYSYNGLGQLIERMYKVKVGNIYEPNSKNNYSYDVDGNEKENIQSDWDKTTSTWLIDYKIVSYWHVFNYFPTAFYLRDTVVSKTSVSKGQFITLLKTVDPDNTTFKYTIVPGINGEDKDNSKFYISQDSLYANVLLQSSNQKVYLITAKTDDFRQGICVKGLKLYIYQPDILQQSQHPLCHDESNGSIQVTASGGTAPYQFQWNGGQITSTISNCKAGTYVVTVTDQLGAKNTLSIELINPPQLSGNLTIQNESGKDKKDGSATINPMGGTAPYQFIWNTGSILQTISNQAPGTYYVTVTDKNGCMYVQSGIIKQFACPSLAAEFTIQPPSCNGKCDGGVLVYGITPANPPFQYQWSNGANSAQISNVCAGDYQLTITDQKGCSMVNHYLVPLTEKIPVGIDSFSNITQVGGKGYISMDSIWNNDTLIFTWFNALGNLVNIGPIFQPSEIGCYKVVIQNKLNCTVDSIICVKDATTSLGENYLKPVRVFPNPIRNEFFIEYPFNSMNEVEMRLINMQGQLYKPGIILQDKTTLKIICPELPPGFYTIILSNNAMLNVSSVIKIE